MPYFSKQTEMPETALLPPELFGRTQQITSRDPQDTELLGAELWRPDLEKRRRLGLTALRGSIYPRIMYFKGDDRDEKDAKLLLAFFKKWGCGDSLETYPILNDKDAEQCVLSRVKKDLKTLAKLKDGQRLLYLLYYVGHCEIRRWGGKEIPYWVGVPRGDGHISGSVNQKKLQAIIETSKLDLLLVLDCCYAAIGSGEDMTFENKDVIVERIGSSSGTERTWAGKNSFTSNLIRVLGDAAKTGKSLTMWSIRAKLISTAFRKKQSLQIAQAVADSLLKPIPSQKIHLQFDRGLSVMFYTVRNEKSRIVTRRRLRRRKCGTLSATIKSWKGH